MEKVFVALEGQMESTGFLLRMLAENHGKWRFLTENGTIHFVDLTFGTSFKRAEAQVVKDRETTEAAIQEWNEAMKR